MAASLQKNTNYKASGEAATTVLQLDEDAVDIQEVVWTEKEEAALVRKIDRGLMPVLCISTAMHYYAKAVISQAAIFGIRGDLKLNTGNRFSMATSIFYLGYMAGSYPITHLAQRFPVEMVLGATVTATGVCVILTGLCHNYQSLYAARFILGMFQGSNPVFALITVREYLT
jgi:MFS family permease